MSEAFLNRQTGTFTETSKQWMVTGDQWSQTYYQWRDGKLYWVENDNKEQQHTERELDIDAVIREHAEATAAPYAEMVAFLVAQRARTSTTPSKAQIDRAWESVRAAVRKANAGQPQDEACVFCQGMLEVTAYPKGGPYSSWEVHCPCGKSNTTLKGL